MRTAQRASYNNQNRSKDLCSRHVNCRTRFMYRYRGTGRSFTARRCFFSLNASVQLKHLNSLAQSPFL
jgi:hypothetical protein